MQARALVWAACGVAALLVGCGSDKQGSATTRDGGVDRKAAVDAGARDDGRAAARDGAGMQTESGTTPGMVEPPTVVIDGDRITVTGAHAAAVVERAPFRISFRDEQGRAVLDHVAPPTSPVAGSIELAQPLPAPAAYAPLSFIVGTRTHTQMGFTTAGNSAGGSIDGKQHAATSVVDAKPCCADGGVELVLATSDPSGRRLRVTLAMRPDGRSFAVSATADPAAGVVILSDSFASTAGEAFRGFGGRHNALDQRGNSFYNWVEQENNQTDQTSVELSPNGRTAAYYVQTSFVSSRGYGFVVDQPEMSGFRLASDRADAWQTSVASAALRYVVAVGDAPSAIGTLTQITGRQPPAPLWALGAIEGQVTPGLQTFSADDYRKLVDADLEAIDRNGTPLTGFQLHQWQHLETLGVLDATIAKIKQRKLHVLVYFKANLDNTGAGYDSAADYEVARKNGFLVRDANGNPNGLVDFTNPGAVAWWQQRLFRAFDRGIDGFMEDFGEQITSDMQFANGKSGDVMHNQYPVLYHQATREAIDRYQALHPDRELWVYSRSGYNGSAAYEGGTFPGDNSSDFGRANGLGSSAIDMLNRSIGGAYGVVNHIAGYFDPLFVGVTKEVFLRWTEWAALSPIFLVHNGMIGGTAHAWTYNDPQVVAAFNRYAQLHIQAAPYIARLWQDAQRTGIPITIPLWLAFPSEAEAVREENEWLLGPDVLVAPVVAANATSRSVYFPTGCWKQPESGVTYQGPRRAEVPAPVDVLPYFFRCDTQPF